ncbi:MAG: hypothetical protein QJR09_08170 [Micrococcus sp.]|nr:hypothetical protein [Micrococcus sp.]
MPKHIREALGTATQTGPGRVKLTLITPGQGSSGTYPAEVLEQAAKDKAFPRGTQMHVNHDSALQAMERPEGDLRNLAGVLLEDAHWEDGALVAEARIGSAWRPFVEEFGEFIGVSIYAAAEIADDGTVTRLVPDPFNRADLVTVAGRGGEITEVLEAARVIESRSIVGEAGNRDVREWLAQAVRAAHGGPGRWAWLRDFDPTQCWFEVEVDDATGYSVHTYQQAYQLDGVEISLTGDPIEVRAHTEYTPVTTDSPTDPAGVTEKKEGATMATIDDKELAQLREAAGRVTALEDENKTLKEARDADALQARKDKALGAVTEAFGKEGKDVPKLYVTAAESAAKAEDYDHDAFTAMVNEAAAALASEQGAGNPTGVGESAPVTESAPKTVTDDDIVAALEGR